MSAKKPSVVRRIEQHVDQVSGAAANVVSDTVAGVVHGVEGMVDGVYEHVPDDFDGDLEECCGEHTVKGHDTAWSRTEEFYDGPTGYTGCRCALSAAALLRGLP